MGRCPATPLLALLALAFVAAACGRERPDEQAQPTETGGDASAVEPFEEALSGRVRVDGSSTLAPLATLAAERFRR